MQGGVNVWKKSKLTAIIIASICAVVLIANYINLKNEKDWMQKDIDQMFQHNFSQMTSDLMTIHLNPDMSEEDFQFFNARITKTGNMAHNIFSLTSYKDNHKLGELVGMIEQATGYDSINTINMSEELHKKLVDIQMYHFTDEEAIEEAYDLMKKSIVKLQYFFTANVVEVHKDYLLLNVSDAGNSNISKNTIVKVSTDVVAAGGCPEFEPNEYARVVIANDADISQQKPIEALSIYKMDEAGTVVAG